MHFKKSRLGPALVHRAQESSFFRQVHVVIGGTGAVGGATVLQLLELFGEADRHGQRAETSPRIVVTARSAAEIRSFTRQLHRLHERDFGTAPEQVPDVGYRTASGVVLELRRLGVDPVVPGLTDLSVADDSARAEAIARFLATGGLEPGSPTEDKAAWLERALRETVQRPFSGFLRDYADRNALGLDGRPFQSVVVGIPMASVATYKLADLDVAASHLGLATGSDEVQRLKAIYLEAIVDDLAEVARELAREVLVAHTTGVGGMYDEEPDGSRPIRLGFAHSAKGHLLRQKQEFAEQLTTMYAARDIKMLITAAAIGIDAILVGERLPTNARVKLQLKQAHATGTPVVPDNERSHLHVYAPADVDPFAAADADPQSLQFDGGIPIAPEYTIRSGENGYFTVSNADALYRTMRVTSSAELGLTLARVAMLGDDAAAPAFVDNICYYTEGDASRQVFALTNDPVLRRNQKSGLEPKALQDLGSAKHQGELHTLGLLILLHRVRDLDLGPIPRRRDPDAFDPRAYFEDHSGVLTLEHVERWDVDDIARSLELLVTATTPVELEPLIRREPVTEQNRPWVHRILTEVLHAAWAVPSLGTPILHGSADAPRARCGFFAAPLDALLTNDRALADTLRAEFRELGDASVPGAGDETRFRRYAEFVFCNHGFADLRPVGVVVSARSADEGLDEHVTVARTEAEFRAALDRLEPYRYFTTSGLIATLYRLRGLLRAARAFDLELGSANEYRAWIPFDDHGRPLLIPGIVEAFRMVWEGLEKNTGNERLDGVWGYPEP